MVIDQRAKGKLHAIRSEKAFCARAFFLCPQDRGFRHVKLS